MCTNIFSARLRQGYAQSGATTACWRKEWLSPAGYSGIARWEDTFLPYLGTETDYVDIELKHGGAEARRSEPGWAAFQQVWPAVTAGAGGAGGATGSSGFDVSGVDTTTFPTLECLEDELNRDSKILPIRPGVFPRSWALQVCVVTSGEDIRPSKSFLCWTTSRAQTAKQALINWHSLQYARRRQRE